MPTPEKISEDLVQATVEPAAGVGSVTLPEGQLIRVEFSLRLPDAATPKSITEWLEFELGARCQMDISALHDHDINADWVTWKTVGRVTAPTEPTSDTAA